MENGGAFCWNITLDWLMTGRAQDVPDDPPMMSGNVALLPDLPFLSGNQLEWLYHPLGNSNH